MVLVYRDVGGQAQPANLAAQRQRRLRLRFLPL
jgi:hypothetical protein